MKFRSLAIIILFSTFIYSQNKYFDDNDKEISKTEFLNWSLKNSQFKVYNDSLGTGKIISEREEVGTLFSEKIIQTINKNLNLNLDKNKPLVITFYPGKDPCNSSGYATPKSAHQWNMELIEKSNKITSTNFLFIYKSKEGLKSLKKDIWYKDPKQLIELNFFKYHYPCSSYVIIFNDKYISYFGEFNKESVLTNLKKITK